MKKKKINLLFLVSVFLFVFPSFLLEIHAEASSTKEIISGESGFDENAHGEVKIDGVACEPKYRLYEDGTLYIYGEGETGNVYYDRNITSVYIEDGICGIGDSSFFSCEKLNTIRIPESVKRIGANAFWYCNFETIDMPDEIKTIGVNAFYKCENLKEIIFPKNLLELKEGAFQYCENLESIEIPEGTKDIGEYVFDGCNSLKKVILPKSLEFIGENAFRGCNNLTVRCNSGTVAEQYARENNISFELLDHTHKYGTSITKEPTCTETGMKTYSCSCGDEYAEEIPSNGHEIVIDSAVTPTETEDGKTEGSHCKVCGMVLRAQKPIPATGKLEEPEVEIKNTFNGCKESPVKLSISCKENDEFTFECKDKCGMKSKYTGYSSIVTGGFSKYSKSYSLAFENSGEHIISVYKNGKFIEYDKIIISENHTWDSGKLEKKETCTENGKKVYTCLNCKNERTDIIPAIGHKYSNWKTTKKPTIFKSGKEEISCDNCGKILIERKINKLKSSVKISNAKLKLKKGKTYKLKIKKQSKGDKVLKWTTSNKKVVSVNKKTGKVKALRKGNAKVTVKMKSGCKATCVITVK